MPFHCNPTCASFEQMAVIDSETEKLKQKSIIWFSTSSYSSRTVLVKRKDGRPRLCIDYRVLNKLIERDNYPIPDIRLRLRATKNAKYI